MPKNRNIIIIEDNETFSLLVTHYIKNNLGDVNVFVENSGKKALESIHRLKPYLIILDYYLEDDLSAVDVMNEINKMNDRPKVILLSSITDEGERQEVMKMGIHSFIPKKNESIYDLVKTIQDLLDDDNSGKTTNGPLGLNSKTSLILILAAVIVIAIIIFAVLS